jgi:protein-S-isoprenylcysteine O-methyltransferase Ste14
MDAFEDTLKPLGIAVGAFLILGALGTLLGAPWATAASTPAAVVQLVGIALVVAVGAGLVWLSRAD